MYLPNPEPSSKVDYIFICMEPSFGRWAKSVEDGRSKVASGFRNFLAGVEPMLLHFSARRFLCDNDDRHFITDFSQGQCLSKRRTITEANGTASGTPYSNGKLV